MRVVSRSLRFMRGALLSYGPSSVKRLIWEKEYREGKWNFIDQTSDDCVYPILEEHARQGSILDLGCGPGNTANELAAAAYRTYVGVDISEPCLEKARRRSEDSGRGNKNSFVRADFLSYVPAGLFDVILFRESMYHIPIGRIPSTLDRYAQYLRAGGVFIVRLNTFERGRGLKRPMAMLRLIDTHFPVAERHEFRLPRRKVSVLVLGPRSRAAEASHPPLP